MNIQELHEALGKMIELGKGDFDVVHVMGNGTEKPVCGFEVVEQGFFSAGPQMSSMDRRTIERRSRQRLKLFTHSPF